MVGLGSACPFLGCMWQKHHLCAQAILCLRLLCGQCLVPTLYVLVYIFIVHGVVRTSCDQASDGHPNCPSIIVCMRLLAAHGVHVHACIVCTHSVSFVYTDKSVVSQPVCDQVVELTSFSFRVCV